LPEYVVPTPSLCDPVAQTLNQPLQHVANVHEEDTTPEESALTAEMVEENEGDGNIFDMLDSFFV
jgi:hypothetical protein